MIVGILSDTHDRDDAMAAGMQLLRRGGARFFIHCGDIGSERVLDHLAGLSAAFVFGNTDWDHRGLQRYAETLGGGPLPPAVWYRDKPLFVRGSRYRGQPVMLTEVGGFLMQPPDLPQEKRDRLYQIYASFRTPEELLEKYGDLMQGLSELWFVSGFCYTQLTDIEQEINGLLTYDRRPKIAPEVVAALHRAHFFPRT